jgi:hypothetical protein
MKTNKKYLPLLALFGAAVLVVVVLRSATNAQRNAVPFLKMLWFEIRFLFSFTDIGSIEVGKPKRQ